MYVLAFLAGLAFAILLLVLLPWQAVAVFYGGCLLFVLLCLRGADSKAPADVDFEAAEHDRFGPERRQFADRSHCLWSIGGRR